jgi:hypothetical protein
VWIRWREEEVRLSAVGRRGAGRAAPLDPALASPDPGPPRRICARPAGSQASPARSRAAEAGGGGGGRDAPSGRLEEEVRPCTVEGRRRHGWRGR